MFVLPQFAQQANRTDIFKFRSALPSKQTTGVLLKTYSSSRGCQYYLQQNSGFCSDRNTLLSKAKQTVSPLSLASSALLQAEGSQKHAMRYGKLQNAQVLPAHKRCSPQSTVWGPQSFPLPTIEQLQEAQRPAEISLFSVFHCNCWLRAGTTIRHKYSNRNTAAFFLKINK